MICLTQGQAWGLVIGIGVVAFIGSGGLTALWRLWLAWWRRPPGWRA